jgi:hypothetical protein
VHLRRQGRRAASYRTTGACEGQRHAVLKKVYQITAGKRGCRGSSLGPAASARRCVDWADPAKQPPPTERAAGRWRCVPAYVDADGSAGISV